MNAALGKHLIAELYVRNPNLLNDADYIRNALTASCEKGGFTVLEVSTHAFAPHGVTAIVLLSESHLSIHTWPEHGYAAVDIFTCAGSPREALRELLRRLDAEHVDVKELDRGVVGQTAPRPSRAPGDRAIPVSRAV